MRNGGWFKDNWRHSLAARGIRTAYTSKRLNPEFERQLMDVFARKVEEKLEQEEMAQRGLDPDTEKQLSNLFEAGQEASVPTLYKFEDLDSNYKEDLTRLIMDNKPKTGKEALNRIEKIQKKINKSVPNITIQLPSQRVVVPDVEAEELARESKEKLIEDIRYNQELKALQSEELEQEEKDRYIDTLRDRLRRRYIKNEEDEYL